MDILRRIFPSFGLILLVFSAAFLVPETVSILLRDGGENDFWLPFLVTIALGLVFVSPAIVTRQVPELKSRDGILLVVLCWTVIPALACLPFIIYFHDIGQPISWSFAYFEAVSGLTTTGATVFVGLDALTR
jgi:trk system potassium uptake protein TrkH